MRALFVAPYLPTPGSGGRTRLLNLMERLSRTHDLTLVAFAARDQRDEVCPYPGTALPPPPLQPRPGGARGRARFYRERLDPLPAFVAQMFTVQMAAAVRDACERIRPDIVQIETTEMAQYLRAIPHGTPCALDLQDVASGWFARVAGAGETRKRRALMRIELRKTRAYDRRYARLADVVFVSSGPDREILRAVSGIEPVEVPNGVDTAAFVPMPAIEEIADRVLFVGPLTYAANLDGMRWFADSVLPLLRRSTPAIGVDLIGERGDTTLPGAITMHGRVGDVRPFFARAPVSIVPVRIGSGTRYKILEALSMERAVVSTTVGAEGLGVIDREHVLIADEPEDFARAVLELLGDPVLRARLGRAGRAHVVARYDWGPLVARVEQAWARVASTT